MVRFKAGENIILARTVNKNNYLAKAHSGQFWEEISRTVEIVAESIIAARGEREHVSEESINESIGFIDWIHQLNSSTGCINWIH